MRRAGLFVTMLLVLLLTASSASAAPGVVQDLAGCDTNTLAANDDDSTDAVPLGFTAQMFDSQFSEVFVNNNGNLTVARALGDFTPFDFRETGEPMIAPFFADVDTNGAGSGLMHYGQTTYNGRPAFCVIWDNVGYYNSHDDKLNRFQAIIVSQPDGVDLVFNYDSISWETGDASDGTNGLGGTSAAAGYAAGDGDAAHALMLPGSFVNGGLLDSNADTSLAGHATAGQPAGRYVFQLRQGAPTGGRLDRQVTLPASTDPAPGALVQICRNGGACVTRSRLERRPSTRPRTSQPAPTPSRRSPAPGRPWRRRGWRASPSAGPARRRRRTSSSARCLRRRLTGRRSRASATTDDGLPVAYWTDPLDLVTTGCPGATATYLMVLEGHTVRVGPLTETPAGCGDLQGHDRGARAGPRRRRDHDPPRLPRRDARRGRRLRHLHRPERRRPRRDRQPALRRDRHAAAVGIGRRAVLHRARRQRGHVPGQPLEPGVTEPTGRFGWDVVAGFYVVTASKSGCVSAADPSQAAATTAVLTIPPPVTNLDLRLDCTPRTTPPPPAPPASGGGTRRPSSSRRPRRASSPASAR